MEAREPDEPGEPGCRGEGDRPGATRDWASREANRVRGSRQLQFKGGNYSVLDRTSTGVPKLLIAVRDRVRWTGAFPHARQTEQRPCAYCTYRAVSLGGSCTEIGKLWRTDYSVYEAQLSTQLR